MTKPRKRVRKPRPLVRWDGTWRAWVQSNGRAMTSGPEIEAVDARRMAKWLTAFADWCDAKEKKGRGK